MELTRSVVETSAEDYRQHEPLYTVEQEAIDIFPAMFTNGEFGFRDAEWIVMWYYRRFLGEFSHARRQSVEAEFGTNDYETIARVVDDVASSTDVTANVERLTDLDGVDVPVATGFLMFIDPESFIVVGEREWSVLRESDVISDPYPDPPSPTEYERYLNRCRDIADRVECDLWTLYMALWRLWKS